MAVCFGATLIGFQGFSCSEIVRVGASFWILGVFLRGFCGRVFLLFSGRFLASAVENVVYFCVFWGVLRARFFLEGSKKRTFSSTLFVSGAGGFLAFRRVFTKPLILLGFRVVTGFGAKTACGTPIFCSVFAGGAFSDLQMLALYWPKPLFSSGFRPVTVGAHFP